MAFNMRSTSSLDLNNSYNNQQLNAISPTSVRGSTTMRSNNNSYSNLNSLSSSKSFNSLTSIEHNNSNHSSNGDIANIINSATSDQQLQQQQLLSLLPHYQIKQYESDVKILFENNTPEQMKSMEYNKRSEIEDMKSQLRNLIGNKYRDLVEGSDAIVKMKKSTELISDNLLSMQLELKQFAEKRKYYRKGASIENNNNKNKEKEIQKKISLFSKYCKFLIDIPEVIWRSLDSNDYFEVSVHFLKSKYLYYKITNENNLEIKRLLSKLPIIEKQWVSMKQFPIKTIGYSKSFLNERTSRQISGTPIEKYIGSLSTLILFEKKSIKETFNEFLLSRKFVLFNSTLSSKSLPTTGINSNNGRPHPTIQQTIEKMIQFLKMSVYYIMVLFYPRKYQIQQKQKQSTQAEEEDEDDNSISSDYQSKISKFKSNLQQYTSSSSSASASPNITAFATNTTPTISPVTEKELNQLPILNFTSSLLESTFNWRSPYLKECLIFYKDVANGIEFTNLGNQNESDILESPSSSSSSATTNTTDSQDIEYSLIEFENFNFNFIFKRTSEWMEEILIEFKSMAQQYLVEIKNAKDLSNLRNEVFAYLFDFKNIVPHLIPQQKQQSSPTMNSTLMTWNRMFNIVCGKDMNYFLSIFDEIFLVKAESVIQESFSKINLFKIQNELFGQVKSEDKNFSEFLWFYNQDDPIQSIKNKTNGITPLNELFLTRVNQLYNNSKFDFIYLLNQQQSTSTTTSATTKSTNNNNNNQLVEKYKINEPLVKEFMKKSFFKSLNDFTLSSQDRVDQLVNNNGGSSKDEILFISKLSKIFYKHIINNPNLYFLNPSNIFDTTITNNNNNNSNNNNNNNNNNNSTTIVNILDTISSPPPISQSPLNQRHNSSGNNINNNNELLKESLPIIDKLKQQFYYGCIVWINEFVSKYSTTLKQELVNQDWNDVNRIKTWEKHIIQVDGNADGGGPDSTTTEQSSSTVIYIPYQTSHFITSYLMSISLEISKFSLNTIDKNILRYIIESITLNLFKIISTILNNDSTSTSTTTTTTINREGYIQLLIDIKYIGFILFGRELNSSTSKKQQSLTSSTATTSNVIIKESNFKKAKVHYQSVVSAAAGSGNGNGTGTGDQNIIYTYNQIIEMIECKLDPIDLAFYSPYIVRFIEQSYSKTQTLFGNFVYLHKSIVKPEKKTSSGQSSSSTTQSELPNPMQLLKTNTKFQLFSIDTIQTITDAVAIATATTTSSTNNSNNNSNVTSPISTTPDFRNNNNIPISTSTNNNNHNHQQQTPLSNILSPPSASAASAAAANTFSYMGKKFSDLMYNKK